MNADATFNVRKQAEAAKRLIAQLRDQGHDDQELIADSIEGETALPEAIAAAIDYIDEREVLIVGLKAKEQAFSDRRQAIEAQVETARAAIEQAMIATDLPSLPLPTATVFISRRKPALIVQNEADIPSQFFKEQERPAPKLDRKALTEALAAGPVPGATLDNGSFSLSVRRK